MSDYCKNCGGDGYVDTGVYAPWGTPETMPCPACGGSGGKDGKTLKMYSYGKPTTGKTALQGSQEEKEILDRLKNATRKRDDVEEA